MVGIKLIKINKLKDGLAGIQTALAHTLLVKSQALADNLVQNVRDGKLSGDVIQEKTGLLKSSIASEVADTGEGVTASVFVSGDVPYAAILEYGGQTKAHIIEASQGKLLAFCWRGKQSFFTHVNHPGSTIAEHSYLRSAWGEMQDDIRSDFANALADVIST